MSGTEDRCGNCRFFDQNRVGGEEVGTTRGNNGDKVKLGLCRYPLGLVLGPREETASCAHPQKPFEEGSFSPSGVIFSQAASQPAIGK